jgi:hypothetical protein
MVAVAGIENPKLVAVKHLVFMSQHSQCVAEAYKLSDKVALAGEVKFVPPKAKEQEVLTILAAFSGPWVNT